MSLSAVRDAPPRDLVIRFVFGFTVSAVAAVIGIVINPRFGGVFLAFPAILPATLTMIEKEKSQRQAEGDDVGAVLGAAALIVFAAIGWWLFTRIGAPLALTSAPRDGWPPRYSCTWCSRPPPGRQGDIPGLARGTCVRVRPGREG